MEIAEFLLARIAEDEAVAHGLWDWMIERHGPDVWATGEGRHLGAEEWQYQADRDMTLHVSPRRVLAECGAKRRILELHKPWYGGYECPTCADGAGLDHGEAVVDRLHAPCPTLRALALPYADHPDYRPEWSPLASV